MQMSVINLLRHSNMAKIIYTTTLRKSISSVRYVKHYTPFFFEMNPSLEMTTVIMIHQYNLYTKSV